MKTPAGKECKFFYGDYYRGRNHEECRLLGSEVPPLPWSTSMCHKCPVPEIFLANACSHMILKPTLKRALPFGKREVHVDTYCDKTMRSGFTPFIGCGECHPLPTAFIGDDS